MLAGQIDEIVGGRGDAAAVEAAGQRVGFGQQPGLRLGLTPLADFDAKFIMPPPAKDDEGDVEQQRVGQKLIGAKPYPRGLVDDLGQRRAAGADEHDDGQHRDAKHQHVALGPAEALLDGANHPVFPDLGRKHLDPRIPQGS